MTSRSCCDVRSHVAGSYGNATHSGEYFIPILAAMPGSEVDLVKDLDTRYGEITDTMRVGLEDLNRRVDEYRRAYRGLTRPGDGGTEMLREARNRLQRLELATAHIASSLAYVAGLGTMPADRDATREIAAMVLEGIEQERQRLYREVHDGPAQVLTNAIFEI